MVYCTLYTEVRTLHDITLSRQRICFQCRLLYHFTTLPLYHFPRLYHLSLESKQIFAALPPSHVRRAFLLEIRPHAFIGLP